MEQCQTSFSAPVFLTVDKYEEERPAKLDLLYPFYSSKDPRKHLPTAEVACCLILSTSNFGKRVGPTVHR